MTDASHPHLGKGSEDVPVKEGKLRLYSMRFCPYAQRVHLILYAKNIPHDVVNINLMDKPEWFLKNFPAGKVPAIYTDGEYIHESLILADYLDEKYPQRPMYSSQDPLRKALDRIIIEEFFKCRPIFLTVYFAQPNEQVILDPILEKLDVFEKELSKRGTKFFSGNNDPGMVDYMIWPWCERLDFEEIFKNDIDRFKNLLKWNKYMLEDSAVKKHYCDQETHKKFFKQYKAGTGDYDSILPK